MAERHFVHIEYFRPAGQADAALDASPREFLSKVFYALSGDYHDLDVWKHLPGMPYLRGLARRASRRCRGPGSASWSWSSSSASTPAAASPAASTGTAR